VRPVLAPLAVVILTGLAACSRPQPAAGSDADVMRAIGAEFGRSVSQLDLSPQEADAVRQGVEEGLKGSAPTGVSRMQIEGLVSKRRAARATQEIARGKAYADAAAKEPGAVKLESGVVFRELVAGTGKSPEMGSRVKFNFKNTLVDGTVIDDSVADGKPAETVVGPDLLPCWSEALPKMKAGGKAKIVCPAVQAFGPQGRPPVIPPGATLVFELQLLEVQ